jgi:hypothetical protein
MLNGYIGFLKKSKQGADEPGAGHSVWEEIAEYDTETFINSDGLEDTALQSSNL